MMKSILADPPLRSILKGVRFFVRKTRSTLHQSILNYKKDYEVRPIFLMGFARSGTTTLQKLLSDQLGYNASFEPMGNNHSHFEEKLFSQISCFFKGAPDFSYFPLFFQNGPLGAIHKISNQEIHEHLFLLLENYFKHLLEYYGNNVIIKEIRLVSNLNSVEAVCKNLEVNPIFLFLRHNPLATLYTYYRLGGLFENSDVEDLKVDLLYEYRKAVYTSMEEGSEILEIVCRNKFDKLLASILLDQHYMERFAQRHPDNSFILDFNDSDELLDQFLDKFAIPKKYSTQIMIKDSMRFRKDPFFFKYTQNKTNPEFLKLIEEKFSFEWDTSRINHRSLNLFLQQKIGDFF